MSIKALFSVLTVTALGAVASGCGGIDIGTGEATEFRIAGTDAVGKGTCAAVANPNKKTTDTFLTASSFVIYGVPGDSDDTYYLEIGGKVLTGGPQDDGSYSFKGETTETDITQSSAISQTSTTTIEFTADGNSISGTASSHQTANCTGSACKGFTAIDCTQTSDISGVEIGTSNDTNLDIGTN